LRESHSAKRRRLNLPFFSAPPHLRVNPPSFYAEDEQKMCSRGDAEARRRRKESREPAALSVRKDQRRVGSHRTSTSDRHAHSTGAIR
jgi:hypothetical protein